eukprot:TRINITY_DN5163_c0_g1_i1.p1 TRINITY_DN5163_c0_g1~~TRINITY_DN5163_c0_g1_i1.p1  ORF type:complete len:182 (-),score=28.14 TRINITY_DN5163_c0_g1_i1:58-603(-)
MSMWVGDPVISTSGGHGVCVGYTDREVLIQSGAMVTRYPIDTEQWLRDPHRISKKVIKRNGGTPQPKIKVRGGPKVDALKQEWREQTWRRYRVTDEEWAKIEAHYNQLFAQRARDRLNALQPLQYEPQPEYEHKTVEISSFLQAPVGGDCIKIHSKKHKRKKNKRSVRGSGTTSENTVSDY